MRELTLQEIKQIELQILKRLKLFCEENNIKYFLCNGTLLGAIKYEGFIPWDDDIDVFVPRKDYDRLIRSFEDDNKYHLYAFEKDIDYRFPFAKLCDLSTYKEEFNIDNGVTLGIDIDIFPLDSWDKDLYKAKQEVKIIKRKMFCLELIKLRKANSNGRMKRYIKSTVMFILKIIGSRYFIRGIIKESNKAYQKNSIYSGCKSWCIYGEREIIPSDVFGDVIEVTFEGESFKAPVGYDMYLRSLYGDYEQELPADEQKTHHCFQAYQL